MFVHLLLFHFSESCRQKSGLWIIHEPVAQSQGVSYIRVKVKQRQDKTEESHLKTTLGFQSLPLSVELYSTILRLPDDVTRYLVATCLTTYFTLHLLHGPFHSVSAVLSVFDHKEIIFNSNVCDNDNKKKDIRNNVRARLHCETFANQMNATSADHKIITSCPLCTIT